MGKGISLDETMKSDQYSAKRREAFGRALSNPSAATLVLAGASVAVNYLLYHYRC